MSEVLPILSTYTHTDENLLVIVATFHEDGLYTQVQRVVNFSFIEKRYRSYIVCYANTF
jgi:hypothetical protein